MNAVAAVAAYDGETTGLSVFLNDVTHLSVAHARPHFTRPHVTCNQHCHMSRSTASDITVITPVCVCVCHQNYSKTCGPTFSQSVTHSHIWASYSHCSTPVHNWWHADRNTVSLNTAVKPAETKTSSVSVLFNLLFNPLTDLRVHSAVQESLLQWAFVEEKHFQP